MDSTCRVVTIADMVRAQAMLIDHLGIDMLFCVAGGSMGGMQVLQWAASYPERVFSALPIATSAKHSSQNIAFHEVGRQAIMADPDWRNGRYLAEGVNPAKGLAVARMAAHITYLSDSALAAAGSGASCRIARSALFPSARISRSKSYLRHQGSIFVERFDPNSYLFMTRAMDYFDLAADYGGSLARAFKDARTRFCIVSFTSDWLFPTSDSRALVHALNAGGASVSFVEIDTDRGHDAFLLDVPDLFATTQRLHRRRGAGARLRRRRRRRSHEPGAQRSDRRRAAIAHRSRAGRRNGRAAFARARRRLRRRRPCCACSPRSRAVDGRGMELSQRGRQ